MTDDQYRSQFRLPYPLYEQLKLACAAQKRSLNAEIVQRLEASFDASPDPVDRLLKLLDERDARLVDEFKTAMADLLKNSVPS